MKSKNRINLSQLDISERYKILTQLIVPRPIAWVSTVSEEGVTNLAPFSYFNLFGSKPPLVVVSCGNRPEGGPKDTAANIEATEVFGINMVSEELADVMVKSSAPLAPAESEIEKLGLATFEVGEKKVPMLDSAQVNMECKLIEIRYYGENRLIVGEVLNRMERLPKRIMGENRLIVGEVLNLFIDDSLIDGKELTISPEYAPIGRLGGDFYGTTTNRFEKSR
ncbi:MAG: flavin reductase family protein [Opitutales bacterium]|nr:flavin reductase family protein [Opitutales bacterium]